LPLRWAEPVIVKSHSFVPHLTKAPIVKRAISRSD
jgi:hypothetical protein